MKRNSRISGIILCFTMIAMVAIFAMTVFGLASTASAQNAKYNDIPDGADYAASVDRLSSLGIIAGVGNNDFQPDSLITREQFAKITAVADNLDKIANAMTAVALFQDVPSTRWSVKYVNIAALKGLIYGMPDLRFNPLQNVTYAQVCTVLLRMLGYSNEDLPGAWPYNYMEEAISLGLTKGMTFNNTDPLPRWAVAKLVDEALMMYVEKISPSDPDMTLAEKTGLFTGCIILADSSTDKSLAANEIITDRGLLELQLPDDSPSLVLGVKYALGIKDGVVTDVYMPLNTAFPSTVMSSFDTSVTLKDNNGTKTALLPHNIVYYYNGAKLDFDAIKGILQVDSQIVFGAGIDNTAYEYAVVYDPIFSKPQFADYTTTTALKAGTIDLSGSPVIIRNSDYSEIRNIQNMDAVYEVTDLQGSNRYIMVIANAVYGTIEAYLPSRMSPSAIQLNTYNAETRRYELKNYDLSPDFDMTKLAVSSYNIGFYVHLAIGRDGKVIGLFSY